MTGPRAGKVLVLEVRTHRPRLLCDCNRQEVRDRRGATLFSVCDLDRFPERAVIGRDLFDANDYVDALRTGIALAERGYTDIEVRTGSY